MADSSYPYAPDQFDEEAAAASYHGAHRAEEPFWRQNLVYLIIIGVAALVLLGLLLVIGGLRGGSDDRAADPTSSPAQSAAVSDGGGDGGGEASTSPEAPAATVDKATPVLVVNAAGTNGLAGAWRDALSADGWTSIDLETADAPQEQAVVFYRDPADAASAQALADEVGAGEARQSDEYDARITFLATTLPQG